jgi:hypothetical protein
MTPYVPNGGHAVSAQIVANKGKTESGDKKTVGLESQIRYWATPDCNTASYSNGKFGQNIREQAAAWPTPTAQDSEQAGGAGTIQRGKRGATLNSMATDRWTTPTALERSGQGERNSALTLDVKNWATPRATDGEKGGPNCRGGRGDPILAGQVVQWPSPASRDYRSPNLLSYQEMGGGKKGEQLQNFVEHRFSSLQDQQTQDGRTLSPATQNSHRRLNPLFAAWLMGWPSTWTIAEPHASSASATESWRWQLQQRLSFLLQGLDGEKLDEAA